MSVKKEIAELFGTYFITITCHNWLHLFDIQKLDYIHFNPCVGKWNLSDCPENYIHSSAKYYNTGIQGIYMIDDIMKMLDIDLSKKILE